MPATVNVNGRVFDQEHAVISVFDHGFLYGEGVYETLRTYNGQPFLFDRHMRRLRNSADMLALGVLAVKTFIEACPEDVRLEHEEALKANESVFDRDLRDTMSAAREGTGRVAGRIRARLRRGDSYQAVSEG